MNEIFVKPAVGAIITKQTDNNECSGTYISAACSSIKKVP